MTSSVSIMYGFLMTSSVSDNVQDADSDKQTTVGGTHKVDPLFHRSGTAAAVPLQLP
jgi:hypothetical protein